MMNIVLIVLSSILLILVIGLIFKKDFREDVLKAENDNAAEFKGLKLKGALFWVIYAATAFGTIYLAINTDKSKNATEAQDCKPLLSFANSHDWLAFDINEEKPAIVEYGCCDKKNQEDHSKRNLNLNLALNDAFEIVSSKSNFVFGKLDKEFLKKLNTSKGLQVEKYIEINYDLQLNPFFKAKRTNNDFYDWNEYENLPLQVVVGFSSERGMHSLILNDEGEKQLTEPLSLNDKWTKIIDIDNKKYLIRLRARDTDPGNTVSEYANFQILQFSEDDY